MDIRETKVGEVVVLEPDGSLTAPADCQVLERKLLSLIADRTRAIVIDGAKIARIGSGAVRALLLVKGKLAPLGGQLVLCALNEKVRAALKISGFDQDFTITSSRKEAVSKAEVAGPVKEASQILKAPPGPSAALRAAVARALGAGLEEPAWRPTAGRAPAAQALRNLAFSLLSS